MRSAPRRHLSHASLVLLLAADLLALTAFVLDQWLAIGSGWAWLLAAVVTLAAMPGLLWLSDKVFAAARATRTIPLTGESFP